jgi:CBS domain containing-hemolysin-like protein
MGTCRTARDTIHPEVSAFVKDTGEALIRRLMSPYSALPVVNEESKVIGIVSVRHAGGRLTRAGRSILNGRNSLQARGGAHGLYAGSV